MADSNKIGKILVVSNDTSLAEIVGEAVSGSLKVIHASDEEQGLEIARKEIPDIIALGYIAPQGTAFELHRRLRQGWITRDIPLLVVDLNPQNPARRVLSMEEGLQVEADRLTRLADVFYEWEVQCLSLSSVENASLAEQVQDAIGPNPLRQRRLHSVSIERLEQVAETRRVEHVDTG